MNRIAAAASTVVLQLLLLVASIITTTHAQTCNRIGPAVIKGNKIFDSRNGKYVPMKGLDYYPRPNAGENNGNSIDFYTDEMEHIWGRDIPIFKQLGVNAIRLYSVDPGQWHDRFFCALEEAGIYVIIGLAAQCENCAIIETDPPNCYPAELKTRGQYIISVFSKYPNVLGFSAGNEVNILSAGEPEKLGVCQKKFIKDMREYVNKCTPKMREVPVGVVLADVDRELTSLYFGCASDPNDTFEVSDWIGINVYLHCNGRKTDPTTINGFNNMRSDYEEYKLPMPVMLTEFGCLNPSFETIEQDGIEYEAQRNWLQVQTLFNPTFTEQFAGGFVFEYITEKRNAERLSPWPFDTYGSGNYGIGYLEPELCDDINTTCNFVPFPQFEKLQEEYLAVDNSFIPNMDVYEPDITEFPQCPPQFPPLDAYIWPSDSVPDIECPPGPPEFIYWCPDTPFECLPDYPGPTTDSPSSMGAPTVSPTTTRSPTNRPTITAAPTGTARPTAVETPSPTGTPTLPVPTVTPTKGITIPPINTLPPFTRPPGASDATTEFSRAAVVASMGTLLAALMILV